MHARYTYTGIGVPGHTALNKVGLILNLYCAFCQDSTSLAIYIYLYNHIQRSILCSLKPYLSFRGHVCLIPQDSNVR